MKNKFDLKGKARLLLYPLFLGAGLSGANAQLNSFTHTYGAPDGSVRVDQNNSNMIMAPYHGSDNYKPGYLMASNVESGGVLSVKLTAIHPTSGLPSWTKTYKGYGETDYGNTRCFAITPDLRDSGYVLTGYRNNVKTKRDELWLMKVDKDGNTVNDFSFSTDSIPCSTNGGLGRPCEIFNEPSFYGMDVLQILNDPAARQKGDFVISGFVSSKPAVGEYMVHKRSFVWRFGLSSLTRPGVSTRYLKVFHHGDLSSRTPQPTSEDYTYEIQEIPEYGLMLLGQIPGNDLSTDPSRIQRLPYYALMKYDGGGTSTLHANVFNYANYNTSATSKHVRTLLGKDDIIYMLGYFYKTHSFSLTPIKPASGGAGQTHLFYSPNAKDLPAFSMYQGNQNSNELIVMGYRLGINEAVREDYTHPYVIHINKQGRVLSKFNLEQIRSPNYVAYTPGDPGGTDYFRPFEKVFPLATTPEIGQMNYHIGYNDPAVAGVLYRGFTSRIERFHATASQFRRITDPAACNWYVLPPETDSVTFTYNPLVFNINNINLNLTRYRTLISDASFDYGCDEIPPRKGSPTAVNTATPASQFQVYPNPARDQVTLRYNGDNQEMQVSVQDITGRTIYATSRATLGQQPYTVDVSKLVPGVYMIVVADAQGQTERFKIVKQ